MKKQKEHELIDRILGYYTSIDIAVFDPAAGPGENESSVIFLNVTRSGMVDIRRLYQAQEAGESIYFRPSTIRKKNHDMIFLDNVPYEVRHTVPGLMVGVSNGRVQMHVPLSEALVEAMARSVQRKYCREKNSDYKIAGDIFHWRLLPGWYNTSPLHIERPFIEIYTRSVKEMETFKLDISPYVEEVRRQEQEIEGKAKKKQKKKEPENGNGDGAGTRQTGLFDTGVADGVIQGPESWFTSQSQAPGR